MSENNGAHKAEELPSPLLSGPAYDALKWVALVLLPGVAVLYVALAALWGWTNADTVSGSIMAVDTFLGLFLGQTSKQFKKIEQVKAGKKAAAEAVTHGVLTSNSVDPDTGIPKLGLTVTAPLEDVLTSDTIKLRVKNDLPPEAIPK